MVCIACLTGLPQRSPQPGVLPSDPYGQQPNYGQQQGYGQPPQQGYGQQPPAPPQA